MSESGPPVWDAPAAGGSVGPVTEPVPGVAAPVSDAAGFATPGPVPTSPVPTAPISPVVRPAAKSRLSGGTLALVLASVVAVGGLAFATGRVTAPATTTGRGGTGFPGASGQPFASGGQLPGGLFGGGAFGGITISGTVTAVRDGELTIKTSSGTEVTIPVDDTTAYHSQASASASDVTAGTSVKVQVTADRGRGPQSSPGALASPGAGGPGAGGQMTFGTATDVTIVGD